MGTLRAGHFAATLPLKFSVLFKGMNVQFELNGLFVLMRLPQALSWVSAGLGCDISVKLARRPPGLRTERPQSSVNLPLYCPSQAPQAVALPGINVPGFPAHPHAKPFPWHHHRPSARISAVVPDRNPGPWGPSPFQHQICGYPPARRYKD